MMKSRFLFVVAALLFSMAVSAQPRAEYPRPQFERADWVNLNGEWSFALDLSDSGRDRDFYNSKGFDGRITVPFAPESKLSGVGYTDFINSVWYQREIQIPAEWKGKCVKLNFGAVYYESEVYIDGKFVGRHYGGSDSFSFDVTDFVGDGGVHSLVVHAESDLRSGTQPGGKQSTNYYSVGCSYTRTTGIWQTVWMEAVDAMALERVQVITDIDQKHIVVIPTYYNVAGGNTLSVVVKDGGKAVARAEAPAVQGMPVVVALKNPKLWSPESPFLYDVVYEVKNAEGETLDTVDAYVGMRKVHSSIRASIPTVSGRRLLMRRSSATSSSRWRPASTVRACTRRYSRSVSTIGPTSWDISSGARWPRGTRTATRLPRPATSCRSGAISWSATATIRR